MQQATFVGFCRPILAYYRALLALQARCAADETAYARVCLCRRCRLLFSGHASYCMRSEHLRMLSHTRAYAVSSAAHLLLADMRRICQQMLGTHAVLHAHETAYADETAYARV